MNDKSNFIPRCGSPLFYPRGPEEDFGAKGLDRRKFLKRTGGATASAFIAWHSSAALGRADETDSSHASAILIKTKVKYSFVVTAAPDDTYPDQIEGTWKYKKSGDEDVPANCIKAGPWDSGVNKFYAFYWFTASGSEKDHEGNSVSFGGYAGAKLWEDDPGDLYSSSFWDFFSDDNDLEADVDNTLSERTWTIDEDTGVISAPVEVLEVESDASPGDGRATTKVSLGSISHRVVFDYNYVSGYTAGVSVTGGDGRGGEASAGGNFADNDKAKDFYFVWTVTVKKRTTVKHNGVVVSDTYSLADPADHQQD